MNEVKQDAYLEYHDGFVVEYAKLAKQVKQKQLLAVETATATATARESIGSDRQNF
jgi:hypothetical protein